jgi:hypothetical protein
MLSVLRKRPILIKEPYPHFIIEDCLPDDIYDQLEKEWPTEQLLATEPFDDGICYRLKSDEMLKQGVVTDLWKEFAEYHTSPAFYKEVKNIFGDLMPDVKDIEHTLSPRGWDKGGDQIGSDCQTVMHKPVDFSSRTPHIDNPREIYAGLLYMPYVNDKSSGGEFQIHKATSDITEVNKNGGRAVGDKAGDVLKSVPYKRNTFVMFCNNSTSTVHSVSARKDAKLHRRSVNIIAEYNRASRRSMFHVKELRK